MNPPKVFHYKPELGNLPLNKERPRISPGPSSFNRFSGILFQVKPVRYYERIRRPFARRSETPNRTVEAIGTTVSSVPSIGCAG
jgi:hypothetical protein